MLYAGIGESTTTPIDMSAIFHASLGGRMTHMCAPVHTRGRHVLPFTMPKDGLYDGHYFAYCINQVCSTSYALGCCNNVSINSPPSPPCPIPLSFALAIFQLAPAVLSSLYLIIAYPIGYTDLLSLARSLAFLFPLVGIIY